jgi:hypothetical protein
LTLKGERNIEKVNKEILPQPSGASHLKKAVAEVNEKLGICKSCIGLSVFLTLIFWSLILFIGPFIKAWYIIVCLWLFACSFSILLILHFLRFLYLFLRRLKGEPGVAKESN